MTVLSTGRPPAEAQVGAVPHPELMLRTGRTLAALTADFDRWISEEIQGLTRARRELSTAATPHTIFAFRRTVRAASRQAVVLGYPLVAEIAASLEMILEALDPRDLPLDVVDAHIETMAIVASDRTMTLQKAQEVVTQLAAAAADFVAQGRAR